MEEMLHDIFADLATPTLLIALAAGIAVLVKAADFERTQLPLTSGRYG